MPIVFDKEKNGFKLENPSEEEMKAIESMAVEYITSSIAKMFGLKGMAMDQSKSIIMGIKNILQTEETKLEQGTTDEDNEDRYKFDFIS